MNRSFSWKNSPDHTLSYYFPANITFRFEYFYVIVQQLLTTVLLDNVRFCIINIPLNRRLFLTDFKQKCSSLGLKGSTEQVSELLNLISTFKNKKNEMLNYYKLQNWKFRSNLKK